MLRHVGFCVGSLFCDKVLGDLSSFAIILLRKLSWLLFFYDCCCVTVCVLCLFLAMPWVGLRSVIITFSGHAHLHFGPDSFCCSDMSALLLFALRDNSCDI